MEEHQVSQQRVIMWSPEVVSRWNDKENFGTFPVDRCLNTNAGDFFQFFDSEVDAVLESVWLDAKVVSCSEAVCRRFQHPIRVDANQVQKLAHHHGYFRCVNAKRTEY